VFYAAFQEKADAMSFESYLKTAPLEQTWDLTDFPLTLEVESNDTIGAVKAKINSIEPSIGVSAQVLIFEGEVLLNDRTLADYNILKESRVQLSSNVPESGSTLVMLGLVVIGLARMKRGQG
jgi:hypothetical protein